MFQETFEENDQGCCEEWSQGCYKEDSSKGTKTFLNCTRDCFGYYAPDPTKLYPRVFRQDSYQSYS